MLFSQYLYVYKQIFFITTVLRPKPTKSLILGLAEHKLTDALHHGLSETSLSEIYPYLNLSEVLAFSVSSWTMRRDHPERFQQEIEEKTLYDVFNYLNHQQVGWYSSPFEWLGHKEKNLSPRDQELYNKMNPFHGRTLEERLQLAHPMRKYEVILSLKKPLPEYVFSCQYEERRHIFGPSKDIVIMTFQTAYPRKDKVVPLFAAEIARILGSYTREYQPYVAQTRE